MVDTPACHMALSTRHVLKRVRMARQNEWQRTATRQEIKLVSMGPTHCKSAVQAGKPADMIMVTGHCHAVTCRGPCCSTPSS